MLPCTSRCPVIIGHRANSGRIILYYKLYRVEYLEADVSASPQGPIVLHGPSDIERASKIGRVFAAIDYLLFYRDPLLNPPLLYKWLAKVSWTRGVLLDVKPSIDPRELASNIEKSGYKGLVMIASKDHEYLVKLRRYYNRVIVLATIEEKLVNLAAYIDSIGVDGVSAKYTILDEGIVKELRDRNKIIVTWTINSPEKALELAKIGVDGIITDRPEVIERHLGKHLTKDRKTQNNHKVPPKRLVK